MWAFGYRRALTWKTGCTLTTIDPSFCITQSPFTFWSKKSPRRRPIYSRTHLHTKWGESMRERLYVKPKLQKLLQPLKALHKDDEWRGRWFAKLALFVINCERRHFSFPLDFCVLFLNCSPISLGRISPEFSWGIMCPHSTLLLTQNLLYIQVKPMLLNVFKKQNSFKFKTPWEFLQYSFLRDSKIQWHF